MLHSILDLNHAGHLSKSKLVWIMAVMLFILINGLQVLCQTKSVIYQTTVNADFTLNNTQIDALPFDKPFTFNIKVDTSVKAGTLTIALKDPKSHPGTTLTKFMGGMSTVTAAGGNLKVNCEGLHPNRKYSFNLRLYCSISDAQRLKIKKIVVDGIYDYIKLNNIEDSTYTNFKTKLAAKILIVLNNKKTAKNSGGYPAAPVVDILNSDDLNMQTANLLTAVKQTKNFETQLTVINSRIIPQFDNPQLLSAIEKLKRDIHLTPGAKTLYNADLMTDSVRFRKINMKLMNVYFAHLADPSDPSHDDLKDILNGKSTFHDGVYDPATSFDIGYISLINNYLKKIHDDMQWDEPRYALSIPEKNAMKDLISYFDNYVQIYSAYATDLKSIDKTALIKSLPDLMANYFVANELLFDDSADVDISTNNTPYVSLDAGVGYNRSFQTFFTNYGVNFYFTPVDKSIPMKTFAEKPWLYVLKTVSFNVSIINNYFNNSYVSRRYVPLISGNKDVFLGLGYRFCRIAKFNLGFDCYYLNYSDPLTTNKYFDARLSASLSLDINFIKGFTNVGTALGLLN